MNRTVLTRMPANSAASGPAPIAKMDRPTPVACRTTPTMIASTAKMSVEWETAPSVNGTALTPRLAYVVGESDTVLGPSRIWATPAYSARDGRHQPDLLRTARSRATLRILTMSPMTTKSAPWTPHPTIYQADAGRPS